MKIGLALRELHASENALAVGLLRMTERHKSDAEVYHVGRDLATWSQRHVREIAAVAREFGEELDPEPEGELGLARMMRQKGSELARRSTIPGLVLLRDLREIYVLASGVSADWEVLAQAAQGIKDANLLALARRSQFETVRQVRWAKAKLKESSTQVLVS